MVAYVLYKIFKFTDDKMEDDESSKLTENGVVKVKQEKSPRPQSASGSEKGEEDSVDKEDSSDVKEKVTVKVEKEDSNADKDSEEKEPLEVEVTQEEDTTDKTIEESNEGIVDYLVLVVFSPSEP